MLLVKYKFSTKQGGWFYKSAKEWEEETYISERQQRTIKKELVDLGVLETKKEGVPCVTWFRVDGERLAELVIEKQKSTLETSDAELEPPKCQTRPYENAELEPPKCRTSCDKTPNYTENTQESTTENTTESTTNTFPNLASEPVCSPNGSQTEPDSKWGGACAENSEHAEFWNENETGEVSLPDGNGEFSGAVECTGSAELPHEGHGRHTSPTPPSQSNHASRFVDDFMGSISATPENQGSDVAPGLRERATEIPKSTQPPESCVISQEKKGSAQNEPIRSSGEIGIVVETEHKPTHPPPSQNAKPTPQELGYPPTWRSNAMRDALERSIEIAFLRYDEGAYMTGDIGRMRRDIARISKFCRTMGEKFKKDASRIAQALFGAFLRLRESKEFWRQKACTPSTMAGQTCLGECWQLCKEMMEEYKKAERQIRTKAEEHPKYVNRWLGRYEWGEVTDEEREAYIKAKLNDKIQKIRGVKHE